jgi:hypothetical protein
MGEPQRGPEFLRKIKWAELGMGAAAATIGAIVSITFGWGPIGILAVGFIVLLLFISARNRR